MGSHDLLVLMRCRTTKTHAAKTEKKMGKLPVLKTNRSCDAVGEKDVSTKEPPNKMRTRRTTRTTRTTRTRKEGRTTNEREGRVGDVLPEEEVSQGNVELDEGQKLDLEAVDLLPQRLQPSFLVPISGVFHRGKALDVMFSPSSVPNPSRLLFFDLGRNDKRKAIRDTKTKNRRDQESEKAIKDQDKEQKRSRE